MTLPNRPAERHVGSLSPDEEDAFIMQMARHDPALFAPLYERYFARVYAYCLRRAGDAHDAEDLCSLVFMRALAGLHTYRGGMVAAWLFQIAHNVVVNHYRGRRQNVSLDDLELPDEHAAAASEFADDGRILGALVAELADDQRNLLALALDADLTSQEIGAVLGKSAVAVRVQLHRLLKHLRQRYLHVTEEGR